MTFPSACFLTYFGDVILPSFTVLNNNNLNIVGVDMTDVFGKLYIQDAPYR